MKCGSADSQEHNPSSIDPDSLLGVGAALALYDSEEDIAHFVASTVTAALRVKFGAVALLNADSGRLRVFGQFIHAPLQDSLAQEIANFLSTSPKKSDPFSGMTIREIEVQKELLPNLSAIGLCRLLVVRLRTLDNNFGVLLAGKSTDEPYLPLQTASLETLAGQTSMALRCIQLNKERAAKEAALRESEERLACILESAMDAIITINDAQRIVLFNEAAEKVFRCPATDAIGQSFDRFLCEPCRNLLLGYVQAPDQSGATKRTLWAPEGLTAIRGDGEEFPIEATISRVELSGQKLYTIILRDINDRQKAVAELSRLQLEKMVLQEEIKTEYNFGEIIGTSAAMKKVFQNIEKVAATDSTVLLTGATGTGKELIARAIHSTSSRKDVVLIKVNCAALPSGLVESELFGHEKGAFTGATTKKKGRFELANGGTIFLDEVGELPLETQTKILRVLQEQEFERVGGTQTQKVNVRVIAATNRDLEEAIKHGAFRTDLFYRLNIFPIHIPALRERIDDIPLLTDYFIKKFSRRMGKRIEKTSPKALEKLMSYDWPGNVRELANILERAVILCEGGVLKEEHIGISIQQSIQEADTSTLQEVERQHILNVLKETNWRIEGKHGAAARLGLNPGTLRSRMQKLGIKRAQPSI